MTFDSYDVHAYLSDEMDPESAAEFERHLETCRCCQALLESETLVVPEFLRPVEDDDEFADLPTPEFLKQLAETPATPEFCVPRTLGKYRLRSELGEGGQGIVYLAEDTDLGKLVALKVLRPARHEFGVERQLLLEEARRSCKVVHPNIIRNLAVEEDQGFHFLVMDYVEGTNLRDRMERGELPPPLEVAETGAQLADALQAIHNKKLIHGDVKPSNVVFCSHDHKPLIGDFGVARQFDQKCGEGGAVKIAGSPPYMSPEQIRGRVTDARSDIFSLGIVLYEMLTGRRLYQGELQQLKQRIPHETPPRMRKLRKGIPKDLETITLKCLEKKPEDRYQSAGEVRDDLNRLLASEPIQATRVSRAKRAYLFVRRKPLPVAVYALSLAVLLTVANRFWVVNQAYAVTKRHASSSQALLNGYVATLTDYEGSNEPGIQWLRQEFIAEAIPYYRDFLATNHEDDKLQLEYAYSQFRFANVLAMNGDDDKARQNFLAARDRFDRLQRLGLASEQDQLTMAMFYIDQVDLAHKLQVSVDDRDCFRSGLEILEKLHRRDPSSAQRQLLLAQTKSNYGSWLLQTGNCQAAEVELRRADTLFATLRESEQTIGVLHGHAVCLSNLALAALEEQQPVQCDAYAQDAIDLWTELLQRTPNAIHFRGGIGSANMAIATAAIRRNEMTAADTHLEMAQTTFGQLLDEDPTLVSFRRQYLEATLQRARIAYKQERFKSVIQQTDRYLQLAYAETADLNEQTESELVDVYSMRVSVFGHYWELIGDERRQSLLRAARESQFLTNLSSPANRFQVKVSRAVYLAWAGDFQQAIAAADSLSSQTQDDGKSAYDLACVYSLAAASLDADESHQSLVERYSTVAVELLNRRATLDFIQTKGWSFAAEDEDLEWLRTHYAAEMEALKNKILVPTSGGKPSILRSHETSSRGADRTPLGGRVEPSHTAR